MNVSMLFNRFGCVVRLDPTELLTEDPALRSAHDQLAVDDHILVSNTVGRAVRVYDGAGPVATRIDLTAFKAVRQILRRHSRGIWQTGVPSGRRIVASAPQEMASSTS
jgi:hypothetical protein